MKTVIGIIVFIAAWQVMSLLVSFSLILPSPLTTFEALLEVLQEPTTYSALASTAWKTFFVLFLVIVTGIPLGFLMGISSAFYDLFRPMIMVVQAVPVISWLALVIFLWGIGWKGPVLISFLSLLPTAVFTTASGVRNLDKNLLEMARLYKVSKKRVLKDIYFGALAPFVFVTVEVSIGNVWKVMVMAEYLCGGSGIGVLIAWARQYVNVPEIYALTFLAVVLGLTSEKIVRKIVKGFEKRWAITL